MFHHLFCRVQLSTRVYNRTRWRQLFNQLLNGVISPYICTRYLARCVIIWNTLGVYPFFVGWRCVCIQQIHVYFFTQHNLERRLRTSGNEALKLLFRMWKTLSGFPYICPVNQCIRLFLLQSSIAIRNDSLQSILQPGIIREKSEIIGKKNTFISPQPPIDGQVRYTTDSQSLRPGRAYTQSKQRPRPHLLTSGGDRRFNLHGLRRWRPPADLRNDYNYSAWGPITRALWVWGPINNGGGWYSFVG